MRSGQQTTFLSSSRWRACDVVYTRLYLCLRASFHKGKRKFELRSGLEAEIRAAEQ